MKRYLAALLVVLGLVGLVGVLAVGRGFADDENGAGAAARTTCDVGTLRGTYLTAFDGVEIKGNDQLPFAFAGYDVFDGNGHVKTVVSINFNGQIIRKEHISGTYTVKADCTGTTYLGKSHADMFIAPDGSMLTFVQINPKADVSSGFELRGTAKRVGP
jgi:hypothetical protein